MPLFIEKVPPANKRGRYEDNPVEAIPTKNHSNEEGSFPSAEPVDNRPPSYNGLNVVRKTAEIHEAYSMLERVHTICLRLESMMKALDDKVDRLDNRLVEVEAKVSDRRVVLEMRTHVVNE